MNSFGFSVNRAFIHKFATLRTHPSTAIHVQQWTHTPVHHDIFKCPHSYICHQRLNDILMSYVVRNKLHVIHYTIYVPRCDLFYRTNTMRCCGRDEWLHLLVWKEKQSYLPLQTRWNCYGQHFSLQWVYNYCSPITTCCWLKWKWQSSCLPGFEGVLGIKPVNVHWWPRLRY